MIDTIPRSALQQHIAVLGKTGSGKTYAVRGAVEQLLDRKERVCIIDPTGAWHGLRSSATGKSAGFPVVIFGGNHADLPLSGTHGEAIAETIGTTSTPAIIDTSLMRVGERTRFFADFADALVRKNKGPLHLVIDEAHLFAPQGKVNDPQSGAMLHAANNLVSLGRSRGLRIILITQRPAKLHKDSLTQVETLIAMRLIAPQDRKAVEEWIKDNADQAKGREILASLATLKTGQGWIWAPELDVLERISFPKIKTFDSGRAPDGSETVGQVLAPIDREAIAEKLKDLAADALANDPTALKRELAAAKGELTRLKNAKAGTSDGDLRASVEAAETRGYKRGRMSGLKDADGIMRSAINSAISMEPDPVKTPVITREKPATVPTRKPPIAVGAIAKGEALVLAACIQHPAGLDRNQLTVLTGYKRSTRDAYIQRLREKGMTTVDGDRVMATDAGRDALPDAAPLPTGSALRDFWLNRLPEGERKVLECVMDCYPLGMLRDDLTEQTGYKRSTRDAYLQRLRSRQLVLESGPGQVKAAETLFDD